MATLQWYDERVYGRAEDDLLLLYGPGTLYDPSAAAQWRRIRDIDSNIQYAETLASKSDAALHQYVATHRRWLDVTRGPLAGSAIFRTLLETCMVYILYEGSMGLCVLILALDEPMMGESDAHFSRRLAQMVNRRLNGVR